jgi:hypothetical protein
MEIVEDDLVAPHLAQKIREHVDRHLLAGEASIAEAERRSTRRRDTYELSIANGQRSC